MRDGVGGGGLFEVEVEGGAVRGVAQLALQAGVKLHVGVACPEQDAKSEGLHAGVWALRLASGLLTMGPDAFFDGVVYGADGMLAEAT